MKEMLSSDEYPVQESCPSFTKLNVLAYITDFCNYNCWYCYNKVRGEKKNLDLDDLAEYVRFLKTTTKREIELELIGGEPSIHPGIENFVSEVHDVCDVVFYTNYSRDFEFYSRLMDLDAKFDISYHETNKPNQAVLDNFSRTPHKNIRGLTIMLDKDRFRENLELFRELKAENPDIDIDIQLVFIGDEPDSYSPEQISEYRTVVAGDNHNIFEIRTNKRSLDVSHNIVYELTKQKYKHWMCNAGKDLLYVHVNGDIFCCDGYFNARMKPIGSIYGKYVIPDKRTLCQVENCPFQDNVKKVKVFK